MSDNKPFNYDLNLDLCGRRTEKTVKVMFEDWDYRAEFTIKLQGNLRGTDLITQALETINEQIEVQPQPHSGRMVMTDANGDELLVSNDFDSELEWLSEMLIGFEVLDIKALAGDPTDPLPSSEG